MVGVLDTLAEPLDVLFVLELDVPAFASDFLQYIPPADATSPAFTVAGAALDDAQRCPAAGALSPFLTSEQPVHQNPAADVFVPFFTLVAAASFKRTPALAAFASFLTAVHVPALSGQ
jgi:hypothetical protein